MSLDFAAINARLLASAESFVAAWIPGGDCQGAEYSALNPKRADGHKGSFKINLETGVWKDFATDDGGGDLVSLYAWLHDLSQGEAARTLAAELGMAEGPNPPKSGENKPPQPEASAKGKAGRPKWTAVVPARPAGAEPPATHFKLGAPTARWEYRTPEGRLAGYVYRFDPPGERKQILPMVWARDERGREEWRWLGFPKPRPLYGIFEALQRAEAPIVVCEGEKAADAAGRLLPEYAALTSQGGAKAARESDWSPVKNREVLIWPDHDPEGHAYGAFVAGTLETQGCRVRRLKIPTDWPAKYDAADFEADGRSVAWLREQLESGALVARTVVQGAEAGCPFEEGKEPWPVYHDGEFSIAMGGVFRGTLHSSEPICLRPIWVHAMTKNLYGAAGVFVKFLDRRWTVRDYAFPASRLNEAGGVLGQELQIQDCPVCPGKEKWISRYLNQQSVNITRYIQSVHRMGWVDFEDRPVFVLPQAIVGADKDEIVYQPPDFSSLTDCIAQKGKLEQWKAEVADLARGNPFLMFGILMGLAAPLLKPCNVEMGGFHFYGLTTGGKTTMLQVAASVWGCGADPQMGPEITSVRKWASTAAGFESLAEAHTDTLLCLDELEQAPADELGKIVFLLAGGISKSRSTIGGGLRAVKTWRNLICSSGEKSLRHQMAQAGQEHKGGKAVRIADVPVDGEDGQRSIFRNTHEMAPKDFGWKLKTACGKVYGLAGPTFVMMLMAEAQANGKAWGPYCEWLKEDLQAIDEKIGQVDRPLPPEAHRVLTRFSLVALAGIRASYLQLLNWTQDEVIAVVRHVRNRWLANLGEETSEQERALAHLRDQIIANESRLVWFAKTDSENSLIPPLLEREKGSPRVGQVRGVMGYRVPEEYGFTATGFRELCGEFDMRMMLYTLKTKGFLNHDEGKLTRKWPRIPELNNRRPYLYSIKAEFMGEEDDTPMAGCPF